MLPLKEKMVDRTQGKNCYMDKKIALVKKRYITFLWIEANFGIVSVKYVKSATYVEIVEC